MSGKKDMDATRNLPAGSSDAGSARAARRRGFRRGAKSMDALTRVARGKKPG